MMATHDTLLDRIVFGAPVFAEDMWMLHQLHEVSRRRSGECGVDVIVASAQRRAKEEGRWARKPMMTAEKAAQALVQLAKQLYPDEALAQACFKEVPQTAEIYGIDERRWCCWTWCCWRHSWWWWRGILRTAVAVKVILVDLRTRD